MINSQISAIGAQQSPLRKVIHQNIQSSFGLMGSSGSAQYANSPGGLSASVQSTISNPNRLNFLA
jgi:hypothetical protein